MTSTSTPATLTTFSSGVIASQEAQAMPMSPTAAALLLPVQPPSSEEGTEPESRPATPQ